MMWQVFEGWDYDDSGIRHAGMFATRAEAEACADDIWTDTRFKAWAVAVNFSTMQATLFGGHQPFGGDWVEEKEIDEPELFGPHKPIRNLTLADMHQATKGWSESIGTPFLEDSALLRSMQKIRERRQRGE